MPSLTARVFLSLNNAMRAVFFIGGKVIVNFFKLLIFFFLVYAVFWLTWNTIRVIAAWFGKDLIDFHSWFMGRVQAFGKYLVRKFEKSKPNSDNPSQ